MGTLFCRVTEYSGHSFRIKLIEDEHSGIVFSDGTFTAGQKYCTRAVREWLSRCEERKEHPTFNFAPDEADVASKEISISGNLVNRVAKRIHDAGGCDTKDDYSRGYDDAVTMALNILLEEIGFMMEDILDYEEQGVIGMTMKIRLNESDYRCGLTECYEHIAVKAGYKPTHDTLYDCRRVCVSRHIQDAWYSYYHERAKEKDPSLSDSEIMRDITMLLLMNGAKVLDSLSDNEVSIERGFVTEVSS